MTERLRPDFERWYMREYGMDQPHEWVMRCLHHPDRYAFNNVELAWQAFQAGYHVIGNNNGNHP